MIESLIFVAFIVGIVSAVSLPLGAITAFYWQPSDRNIAILMAFGGGALLAALTIDLVASAVDNGYFHALAMGAILGGLLFVGLNHIVNDFGGFLRKVSTTVYHLRRKQHEHLRRISRHLKRVDLFGVLKDADFKILAESIQTIELKKGGWVYQQGDPSDSLYLIISGHVELINLQDKKEQSEQLKKYDVFGWRALITRSPSSYSARAISDATLWVLPRKTIDKLNKTSVEARQKVIQMFESEDILSYLHNLQGQSKIQAEQWLNDATDMLKHGGEVPVGIPVLRHRGKFKSKLEYMQHIPLTQGLSLSALKLISERLIYKKHDHGSTFYHQHEIAERMFIIEHGEVTLLDAKKGRHESMVLNDYDAFGDISMITGAKHSVTAVASVDTRVWELRKTDFDELLTLIPELSDCVRAYIQRAGIDGYLVERHEMDGVNTARWARRAMRSIDAGRPIPAAAYIQREFISNKGAPLAIWLGITLDGIPESLVIGASMIDGFIPLSLVTGLFLSNYPEALSSSIGMRKQGLTKSRVFFMWSSLMLFTGIGAALGSIFFIGASPATYAFVQG
ncbi:MAG: cyclic nucleotide-binding domain-containing protein, partial [Gammaproteobacteria bacterium]|nr:cyclic nucleotide-binding domain-containing protein [Gammaproteobacteria bacterium]